MTSVQDTSLGLLSFLQSQGSLQNLNRQLGGWSDMLDVVTALQPNHAGPDLAQVPRDIYQLAANALNLAPPVPIRGPQEVLKRAYDLYLRDYNFYATEWTARHRPQFECDREPTRGNGLTSEIFRWWTSDISIDRQSVLEFWKSSSPLDRRQGLNLFMGSQGFRDLDLPRAQRILDLTGLFGSPIEIGIETMPQIEGARLILGDENSARTTRPGAIMSEHTHPFRDQDYLSEAAYVRGTPSAFREDHVSDDLRVLLSEAQESSQRFFSRRVLHPNSGTVYTYDAHERLFELFLGVSDSDCERPTSDKAVVNSLRRERSAYLLDHLASLRRITEKNGYSVHFYEVPYLLIVRRSRVVPKRPLLETPAQNGGQRPKFLHQILKLFKG